MRSFARLSLVLALILVLGACGGDDEPSEEKSQQEGPQFSAADVEGLVPPEPPPGFVVNEGQSGPQSAYQALADPERSEAWIDLGHEFGWLHEFDVKTFDPLAGEEPEADPTFGAAFMFAAADVFPDSEKAAEAVTYLREHGAADVINRETADQASLGEDGYKITYERERDGETIGYIVGYRWRVGNASFIYDAHSLTSPPDEAKVLELAQEVHDAAEKFEPGGGTLEPPPEASPGDTVFEDDFSDRQGWTLQFEGEPPGQGATYTDDGLKITISEQGVHYNDTTELDDPALAELSDVSVEADATRVGGVESTTWGLVCRTTEEGGPYYLLAVRSDGSSLAARGSTTEPFSFYIDAPPSDEIKSAIEQQHTLRADCVGSPIARLSLFVNGELVFFAYDDDPIEAGGAGVYGESGPPGGSVLFDNLVIKEA